MSDAELQIGCRHLPNVLPRRNRGLRQRRRQTLDPGPPVGELDPHERVGNRVLKPVDPNLHEAVSQQETADAPEGQVVQQLRKGYRLRDRLLRPATVIVAKPPSTKPA